MENMVTMIAIARTLAHLSLQHSTMLLLSSPSTSPGAVMRNPVVVSVKLRATLLWTAGKRTRSVSYPVKL